MYGFERKTFKPKVIKFFTGHHWEMREDSSIPEFYNVVEEFDFVIRCVKPIKFFTVVKPWCPDDNEGCFIFF